MIIYIYIYVYAKGYLLRPEALHPKGLRPKSSGSPQSRPQTAAICLCSVKRLCFNEGLKDA